MTINISDNDPRISYTVADGVTQTSFAVPFEFFTDSDVIVYVNDVIQTITTDYTISGGDGSTGTVTMSVTGPATVVLVRDIPIERITDFPTGIDINRAALNTQLDTLTAIAADIDAKTDRAVKLSATDTGSLTLPPQSARAGKFAAFDANGDIEAIDTVGDYRGDWAASTAYYRKDLVKDTTTGNIFICEETHSSSGSLPITTNADSAKWSLVLDFEAATDAQTAAEAAQTAAEAAQSAAETAETNAATSESNAATSESNAASSAAAAAASYDSFDDRYLGAKASDPATDNDGDALVTGALYFNTTDDEMRIYDGASWLTAFVPSSDYVSKTGATGSGVLPAGTDAQRDGTPAAGYIRFNTTSNSFEGYNGSAWTPVGGGGLFKGENGEIGTAPGDIFRINEQTLNTDVTIDADENASATGPLTVASGVTLTVTSGGNLSIV